MSEEIECPWCLDSNTYEIQKDDSVKTCQSCEREFRVIVVSTCTAYKYPSASRAPTQEPTP